MLLLIGMIFGYGVKGFPEKSVFRTRAWVSGKIVVTLFAALVYYSYLLAPDWMFNYFTRASDIPHWMIVYIFLLYYFAYGAGFLIKFEAEKLAGWYPLLLIVVFLAASIAVPVALGERYTMVGTMDEFLSGTALPLQDSPVGRVPGMLTLALVPIALLLLWWSRRERVS